MAPLQVSDLLVVPHMAAHDASSLDLTTRSRVLRRTPPGDRGVRDDLRLVDGREHLAQAILLRLLTPVGSLAPLGHASYGSRLHELIGRRKTEELRNLCRAFVLEAVAQEPRVDLTVADLRFEPDRERFDSFVFTLAVRPGPGADPVGLSLEVGL
jgi:phage baseplate assembly protein W